MVLAPLPAKAAEGAIAGIIELSLSREHRSTLQDQIVQQVRGFILSGSLRPGAELPSSRELAAQYDISRNTITHAYGRLINEGYLVTAKGIGTKVTTIIPDTCQFISGGTHSKDRSPDPVARAPTVFRGVTLEDDYDCDFNYSGRPLLSLAGASTSDSVIYLGTFSKALGAGVRTGFIIFPRHLIEVAFAVKTMTNYGHPWLEQAILAGFLRGETFQRHLRFIRKAYLDTLDHLTRRLTADFGPVELWGTQNGMHVMWRLPRWVGSAQTFKARVRKEGVYLHTLASGGAYDQARGYADSLILLGYAALSGREVVAAARVMAKVAEASAMTPA